MYPNKETAIRELELAYELNPGPWTEHSKNVGLAARLIAEACGDMDADKAEVCGLLHDIGRRTGISQMRHVIDGYDYCIGKGWNDVARVCLTHSFPIKDANKDLGKKDVTPEQFKFINDYIHNTEYDDYDKLIIVCDSLATANGFCILEKRFVDTTLRYGAFPFTVERWKNTIGFKEEFDERTGKSIYSVLRGIESASPGVQVFL